MKKITKVTMITLLILALLASIWSVTVAQNTAEEALTSRRSRLVTISGLRQRIRSLEADIKDIMSVLDSKNTISDKINQSCGNTCEVITNMSPETQISEENESLTEYSSAGDETENHMNTIETQTQNAGTAFCERYIMREYDGMIGIFSLYDDNEHLVRILNVSVATLPTNDRSAIEAGILTDRWDELMLLIDLYS